MKFVVKTRENAKYVFEFQDQTVTFKFNRQCFAVEMVNTNQR